MSDVIDRMDVLLEALPKDPRKLIISKRGKSASIFVPLKSRWVGNAYKFFTDPDPSTELMDLGNKLNKLMKPYGVSANIWASVSGDVDDDSAWSEALNLHIELSHK